MRSNGFFGFLKDKGVLVALGLCLVSAAVITGIYTMQQNRDNSDSDYVDLSELQDDGEEDIKQAANDQVTNETEDNKAELEDDYDSQGSDEEAEEKDEAEETASDQVQAETNTIKMDFQDADKLTWPVNGNVIMNYSMDQTIYFSTLDQYKYNPAIVIAGEVNTKVLAAASGKVTSVEVNEETGNTVTLDMGNGYQAVYGQLKEIPLAEGDIVAANEVIGYISEPTKYYSVEGANLYFQLVKNEEAVNPMDYLE